MQDDLLLEVSPLSLINKQDSEFLGISDLEIQLDANGELPVVQKDDIIPQASNCCTVTNYDKFSSLLIGSCCVMHGVHYSADQCIPDEAVLGEAVGPDEPQDKIQDETAMKEDQVMEQEQKIKETPKGWTQFIENILQYHSRMSPNEQSQLTDEMLDIWSILQKLLHFGEGRTNKNKKKSQLWILQLAMLLFVQHKEAVGKLSFVDSFAKHESLGGEEIERIKDRMDGKFKKIIYQIGSFVNLYETIAQCKTNATQGGKKVFNTLIFVKICCIF